MSLSSLGAGANVRSRRRGVDLDGEVTGKGAESGDIWRGVSWSLELGVPASRNIPCAEPGLPGVRA